MVRFILTQGIGFAVGSTQYLPTLGFSIGAAVVFQPVWTFTASTRQFVFQATRRGIG